MPTLIGVVFLAGGFAAWYFFGTVGRLAYTVAVSVAILLFRRQLAIGLTHAASKLGMIKATIDRMPSSIKLAGATGMEEDAKPVAAELSAAGFVDAGAWDIPPMPKIKLALMVHPVDNFLAAIETVSWFGAQVNVHTLYADGGVTTYTNSKLPGPKAQRPGTTSVRMPGASVAALLSQARNERRPDGISAVSADDAPRIYERLYTESIRFRKAQGAGRTASGASEALRRTCRAGRPRMATAMSLRDTLHMNKFLLSVFFLALAASVQAAETLAPAARTIVLVRHGNYVPDPTADARLGPGIAPLGVAQAHLVGARLAGLPNRFDALYVSPLQRARDTAAVIGADFPGSQFKVVDDLAECTPPSRRVEIMSTEKAEDLAACKAQLDRVFADYFRPASGTERTELFVCHGNVIRYLVTRALGVDTAAWLEMSVGHASITRIRIEANGSIKVISVGDVGHLPPNMLSGASGDSERSLAIPPLSQELKH